MSRPKLIIHLDINGTIMPADPIKSKHVRSMLNIHLSKQAFVREDTNGDIVWWDGSPFHRGGRPPLLPQFRYSQHIKDHYSEAVEHTCEDVNMTVDGSVPIEDYRNAVSGGSGCDDFTNNTAPGHVYEADLLNLMDILEWKFPHVDSHITEAFTLPVTDDTRRMSVFVPSFLSFIRYLATDQDRDFVFVIRTFGSDIPRLVPAFKLLAEGKHPLLNVPNCIRPPSWIGSLSRIGRNEHRLSISHPDDTDTSPRSIIEGNDAVASFLESLPSRSVVMINDDYEDWKSHDWNPVYGKPIFLNLEESDECMMHFLFDDNVNMNPKDSIACVWLKSADGKYKPLPLNKRPGLATIGTVLLQANLYKSITDDQAFISELVRAEKRYKTLRDRMTG